ncbi:hypothetical protein JW824_11570 [bacterium]|nr:hypothetical protein [bacterium]
MLIMCDLEGNLAAPEEKKRIAAVDNHDKWVEAAKCLGCHYFGGEPWRIFESREMAVWSNGNGQSSASRHIKTSTDFLQMMKRGMG